MQPIDKFKEWLQTSRNIVFFGGAGVSTESGLPDFRSVDGLYNQEYAYPPEEILSHSFFYRNPEEFFRFYRNKLLVKGVKPNEAHKKLAQWESEGRLKAVVTQNIDGLHQAAGSKNVFELHGSILHNHCVKCGRYYPLSFIEQSGNVPRCECGGIIKPDVVLYGEGLDEDTVNGAVSAIEKCDMLIIGGTSLNVYPAAGFVRYYTGNRLVLINKSETPLDHLADLIFREPIGRLLSAL